MKFKVGDRVKVIDRMQCFNVYNRWIEEYCKKYKNNWICNDLVPNGIICEIKVIAPHATYGKYIYLIQDIKTKQVYIIGKKGIEKTKEKYFKSLPDNYTGTIEVKNGYIIEQEILDDVEKKYLTNVIKPFKNKVESISKQVSFTSETYIRIIIKEDSDICLPNFKSDTMYKGMVGNKEYTLKELGLDVK